ncbi:hypothetical protein BamIOP4010DRAFT_5452 [Burkholderia ambifaria IOP40-10]|jgi:hypothetical protein|uniref:Uncharacterized protein n=1 Tax=Burkholderia ambifaria IOP40-10 TaxID=396596 RepID=B1FN41_9BURK|nr:hypothetical protein BamIOP4010DRAFT_5452 [Burkholderia ambifaria IOP40-10]
MIHAIGFIGDIAMRIATGHARRRAVATRGMQRAAEASC